MQAVYYLPDDPEVPAPTHVGIAGGSLQFARSASSMSWPQYHLVDADAPIVDHLEGNFEYLESIPADRLEELLGGSADAAIKAIKDGKADDVLDAVLFAERERDDRVTVVSAIAERSDQVETMQAQDEETAQITPSDVTTA